MTPRPPFREDVLRARGARHEARDARAAARGRLERLEARAGGRALDEECLADALGAEPERREQRAVDGAEVEDVAAGRLEREIRALRKSCGPCAIMNCWCEPSGVS
jgi:hypothetical protein